jgi:hypothetical protein
MQLRERIIITGAKVSFVFFGGLLEFDTPQ